MFKFVYSMLLYVLLCISLMNCCICDVFCLIVKLIVRIYLEIFYFEPAPQKQNGIFYQKEYDNCIIHCLVLIPSILNVCYNRQMWKNDFFSLFSDVIYLFCIINKFTVTHLFIQPPDYVQRMSNANKIYFIFLKHLINAKKAPT